MYFDPLTAWLVTLVANGISISAEHTSKSEINQHYRDRAKFTNNNMNASILRIRDKGRYRSAEEVLKDIKIYIQTAQKSYEIRQGYAQLELSLESYEFIVKLCKECKSQFYDEYTTVSRIYNDRVQKGEPKENLSELRKRIDRLHQKANSYQTILDLVEKERTCALKKEEEKAKKIAESDSNGVVVFKSIIVIVLIILAFAICLSGEIGKLGMGLLLIVAAVIGYFILDRNKT